MFKQRSESSGLPHHFKPSVGSSSSSLTDADDKYGKIPRTGHPSKTSMRFRLKHGVMALAVIGLTYWSLQPRRSPSVHLVPTGDSNRSLPNGAIWEERKDKVKAAFQDSWSAYRRDAWGKDEYHPVSMQGSNMIKNGQGFTIVDSLDTMWIMGLQKEFKEARAWVDTELSFDQEGEVNLFETTIRVMGGLLSAYHLSQDRLFLNKAVDLADRLMGAFDTASGIPYASVHLKDGRGVPGHEQGISTTSEVSTIQLEFKYLSFLTGNDKYWKAAEEVILKMRELPSLDGLVPIFINPYTGEFHGAEIRLGSRGDSYYEYLIKQYLQTSKLEPVYKEMYDYAISGVKKHLIGRTYPNNLLYVGEISMHNPQDLKPKMDHLVCFLGGTMALSSTEGHPIDNATLTRSQFSEVEEEDFKVGEELTKSCYEMYRQTETGLASEIVYWVQDEDQIKNRKVPEYFDGSDFIIHNRDGHNWLRPETVESLFYLWQLTRDEKYREWGWKIFEAIEKYSKVETGGYSSIHDIRQKSNIQFSDKMETFYLAETLKYLYLLFAPVDTVPLDKFVFNTEAHPLPIFVPPRSMIARSKASTATADAEKSVPDLPNAVPEAAVAEGVAAMGSEDLFKEPEAATPETEEAVETEMDPAAVAEEETVEFPVDDIAVPESDIVPEVEVDYDDESIEASAEELD
ncbi:endoplasmic reticulum Man9GlcNAc2 1,2-alpha-mannosidase [Entomortierella parvispora]|uniref:alpha-1,2-Mannosidase n=1 Tax=Entomortierella parvispora TaxID=205924 RepID=A0A9P3HBK5_9FUNG|nr:endoplasmic reticulum Man9GlcNAc2 1,2-alpha-mannosidase [Entomortierella parvispora]